MFGWGGGVSFCINILEMKEIRLSRMGLLYTRTDLSDFLNTKAKHLLQCTVNSKYCDRDNMIQYRQFTVHVNADVAQRVALKLV